MKVRKPMTLEQIARKSGKDPERVQKLLDEMSVIGLIEYNWENADHHKQYVPPDVCARLRGIYDDECTSRWRSTRMLADFFEQMARLPLEKVTPMVPAGRRRVSACMSSLWKRPFLPGRSPPSVEHISHWLNKYQGQICGRRLFLPPPAARARRGNCGEIWRMTCASASAIWQIISWRQGKAATSHQEEVHGDSAARRG